MPIARSSLNDVAEALPRMPSWIPSGRKQTLEDVAFYSGAALATLHIVGVREDVPHALLRDRLSLSASEACMRLSGRPERAGELRDEVHLLRAGDRPGPAGAVYLQWQRAVVRPVSVKALQRALQSVSAEQIAAWLDAAQGGPVGRAATVLEAVLAECPGEEAMALILADAALARALGWSHIVPLLALNLKSRDLRITGDDLRLACHQSVVASAQMACQVAVDLARRTARLEAILPKLRAKKASEAVSIFLNCDAATATALPLPDRAARRLCDRLVDLGVVRELSGRDSFRIYGV